MKGETISWTGTKTVVLGMGRSGLAAAEWLFAQKAEVTVFDESKSAGVKDLARRWEARGAHAVTGLEELPHARFDRAILSPGIDPKRPVVVQLRSAKVPMLGELELGARACLCPILAITGTNGKTSTAMLLQSLMEEGGLRSGLLGTVVNDKPIGLAEDTLTCDLQGGDNILLLGADDSPFKFKVTLS